MWRTIGRSIRLKVMLLMIVTAFAALTITAVVLVIHDARRYEAGSATDLKTQADMVGRASSAALDFDDPVAARQTLASLAYRPRISKAALYTTSGVPFAAYVRHDVADSSIPSRPGRDGYRIEGAHMTMFQQIVTPGGMVGTVHLQADYQIRERVIAYLQILAGAMVASLLIAALLSFWLQARVTRPIVEIAGIAHRVKERRDLTLRATKTSHDEVGDLVDTFNDMIAEVGQRTTALERANRTLQHEMAIRHEAEQALRHTDQKKDEFLATLAHELRNPLAPLRTSLEILAQTPDDPETGRRVRAIMDRQLRQLTRLVDDLLDVSRITTGKLKVRREPADLEAVIQRALDAALPFIEERRLRFTLDQPPEPVAMEVDAARLAQVLLNLLHNAAKFTEPGCEVALRARIEPRDLVFEVSDTGIGIPAEMLPVVFGIFEQLDRTLERPHAGLGVGLSLARRLVELHGGTLEARSAGAGRGATFTVRLPCEENRVRIGVAPDGATAAAPPGSASRRVMLVDDNRDFVTGLALLLERHGHRVAVAYEGRQALEVVASFEPDVAFLDIGLPGLSGYDLARAIRETPAGRSITLYAVTGWGQDHDKRLALEAGFDRHFVKPIEIEAALLAVSEAPPRRASSDEEGGPVSTTQPA
jgi:signal transduction histidine kinase/CheY-like chemotaxis protein